MYICVYEMNVENEENKNTSFKPKCVFGRRLYLNPYALYNFTLCMTHSAWVRVL